MKMCAAVHVHVPYLHVLVFDFLRLSGYSEWIGSSMQNHFSEDTRPEPFLYAFILLLVFILLSFFYIVIVYVHNTDVNWPCL